MNMQDTLTTGTFEVEGRSVEFEDWAQNLFLISEALCIWLDVKTMVQLAYISL